MDRVDLTQEALEALQPSIPVSANSINHDEARKIRGRLLGALIRKCRLEAGRSPSECGIFMNLEPELIEAWEYGESEPSLPHLELLAQFLNGSDPIAGDAYVVDRAAHGEYVLLRQRMIGALLRTARESSGRLVEEVSASAGLEAVQLSNIEFGVVRIRVSDLTALAQALGIDMAYFAATPKSLPEQARTTRSLAAPAEARSDWRVFAAESDNLPFIRLAMAFQCIARDDLHRIADALFAIIRANGDSSGWSGSPT